LEFIERSAGEGGLHQRGGDRRCDLASGMTPHAVCNCREAVATHDGVFVVVAHAANVHAAGRPQLRHRSPSRALILNGCGRRCLDRQQTPCEIEGLLPLRCIARHSPNPGIEVLDRGIAKERSDVGERHARLSQRVDQSGFAQLTR
jgi:hypothetical protein